MKIGQFFVSMFKVGCIGFGGGSALIPILHKTYVEELKVIEEAEYEEAVVVSSITPGALTIKLAGEIGRHVAGWKGMLAGSSAMALPGVLLTVVLLSLLTGLPVAFAQQMEFISIGVMAYIACMLTDYIVKTVRSSMSVTKKYVSIGIICLVLVLTCGKNLYRLLGINSSEVFYLSTIEIFIATFAIIFLLYGFTNTKTNVRLKKMDWSSTGKEVAVMLGVVALAILPAMLVAKDVFAYAVNGVLSSMISFGGGDAYLTVADGLFVSTEIVSEDAFYGTIIPLVNLLPGSILCKALSGIGYWLGYTQAGSIWGGYVVALLGFACSFAASCGIVSVVGALYRSFGELPIFQAIKQWIRPVVSGLMLNVILSLVYQSRVTGISYDMGWMAVLVLLLVYVVNLVLFYKKKANSIIMVIVSVGLSLLLCNIL